MFGPYFASVKRPETMTKGLAGADSLQTVTPSRIDEANTVLTNVVFWGRYFSTPSKTDYSPRSESQVLHDRGIRVLPIARQTKRVNGTRADGVTDGNNNAQAVLDAFGANYLAKQGGVFLIFLDVEDDKANPALSAEYWKGWTTGLAQGTAGTNITFKPALYVRQYANNTWNSLAQAMKDGAPCAALYVAHWCTTKHCPIPPPDWSADKTNPMVKLDCPVYIWQYQDGLSYDCDELNPFFNANEILQYLILPPGTSNDDHDPIDMPTPVAAPEGLDVSHFQGDIDWSKVVQSGVRFAFMKASQGIDGVDSNFGRNWPAAKQAGLARGAYHYFGRGQDGKAQALHFLRLVAFEPGDLPPVLAVNGKRDAQGKLLPLTEVESRDLLPRIRAWLEEVETSVGCTPILHTTLDFWQMYGSDDFGRYPLWIIQENGEEPMLPKGWNDWAFWQYSVTGTVAGLKTVAFDRCKNLATIERVKAKNSMTHDLENETRIPTRPAGALTGSQFADEIRKQQYSGAMRDRRVLHELRTGNIPNFYRKLVDITVRQTFGGVEHNLTYRVMPDYLAIGSDEDYLRMPMSPLTAQAFGDEFGFTLPTPKMVDQIHGAAEVKLDAGTLSIDISHDPMGNEVLVFEHIVAQNKMVEAQLAQRKARPGALVDGDKKDVVISNRIATHPKKVVIYGWHYPNNGIRQPLFPKGDDPKAGHDLTYMDYSHGLRMVSNTVVADGEAMSLSDLLANETLCRLVSDEGLVSLSRYQGTATTPLAAPGDA